MVGHTTANCGYFLPSSPLMQILGIPSIQLEMMRWEGKLVLWPASGTMQHLDMGDLHPLHILSASIPLSGILGRNITLWICCNSSQFFSKGKVKTLNKLHLPLYQWMEFRHQITYVLLNNIQTGTKCVSVAAALRAEQGSWEPIKDCISEIREQ